MLPLTTAATRLRACWAAGTQPPLAATEDAGTCKAATEATRRPSQAMERPPGTKQQTTGPYRPAATVAGPWPLEEMVESAVALAAMEATRRPWEAPEAKAEAIPEHLGVPPARAATEATADARRQQLAMAPRAPKWEVPEDGGSRTVAGQATAGIPLAARNQVYRRTRVAAAQEGLLRQQAAPGTWGAMSAGMAGTLRRAPAMAVVVVTESTQDTPARRVGRRQPRGRRHLAV